MPPPLEHQVAIITGAASGIGLAIARRLADDGATVVIADINEKDGREAAEQIGAGKAVFQPLDVTTGGVAQAGGLHRHRPPCPDVKYGICLPRHMRSGASSASSGAAGTSGTRSCVGNEASSS